MQNAEIKRPPGRPRKSNAVNSWETKNTVSRVKFEHVSRLLRELQYLTYHGKEDHASVDAFLCFRDEVTPTVKFGEPNKREGGPKFFIQATPNYPVEKLANLFLEIGQDMRNGATRGDNWEMVTSGYDLFDRLFGDKIAKTLATLKPGNKGAKAAVPVLGPGYDDLKDNQGNVAAKLIVEWPENEEWQEKFRHWGPNGIQNEDSSSSSGSSNSSSSDSSTSSGSSTSSSSDSSTSSGSSSSSSSGSSTSSGSSRSRSSRSSPTEANQNLTGMSATVVSSRDSQTRQQHCTETTLASSDPSASNKRKHLYMTVNNCRLQLERSQKILSASDSNDNHN